NLADSVNYYSCMIFALLCQRLNHSYATFLFYSRRCETPDPKIRFARSTQYPSANSMRLRSYDHRYFAPPCYGAPLIARSFIRIGSRPPVAVTLTIDFAISSVIGSSRLTI